MEIGSWVNILQTVAAFFLIQFYFKIDKLEKELNALKLKYELLNEKFNRHLEDMGEIKADIKAIKTTIHEMTDYVHAARHELKNERQNTQSILELFDELNKKLDTNERNFRNGN